MDATLTQLLVFVLDLAASPEAIVEVRRKLQSFRNEILNDPSASNSVELAFIAADSTVKTLVKPTSANRCIIPLLHAATESTLAGGIQAGFSLIQARLNYYQQQAIAYKKPVLILLTSHPANIRNSLTDQLNDSQTPSPTGIIVRISADGNEAFLSSAQADYTPLQSFSWLGLPALLSVNQVNPIAASPTTAEKAPSPSESIPSEHKPMASDWNSMLTMPGAWPPIIDKWPPYRESPAKSTEQEINCSTYAPLNVRPGEDFMVVATLHSPDGQTESDNLVKRLDATLSSLATKSLLEPLQTGQRIIFRLLAKGAGIDEPIQEIKWHGKLTSVEFVVSIPPAYVLPNLYASLSIFRDNVPLGSFKFNLVVSGVKTEPGRQAPDFQAFRKAFISYSSKDRTEVLKRVQGIESLGQKVFIDLVNLASGERWESRLYQQIEASDVFYLFWSAEAKQSKWVKQEWQYALQLREQRTSQSPEIIPILIEGPPPPSPPRPLRHLHFNDRYLYFIGK